MITLDEISAAGIYTSPILTNCPNCGANTWKRSRCAYCGTERSHTPAKPRDPVPGVTVDASAVIRAYLESREE